MSESITTKVVIAAHSHSRFETTGLQMAHFVTLDAAVRAAKTFGFCSRQVELLESGTGPWTFAAFPKPFQRMI